MRLIMSLYPKRKMLKHSGDSTIIYEGGKRVTDIDDLEEAFEDTVKENEGSFEVALDQHGVKKVPKTDGTYPNELAYDKKVLSKANLSIDIFRPTAFEMFETLRLIKQNTLKEQLLGMLFSSEIWLSEICDGLAEYKERIL